MTDNTRYNGRAALRSGRLALLGSVAVLGAAVLVAGPAGYLPMPVWSTSAHAADATSTAPAGFADLVTKVKPAVISVRLKMNKPAKMPGMTEETKTAAPCPSRPVHRWRSSSTNLA